MTVGRVIPIQSRSGLVIPLRPDQKPRIIGLTGHMGVGKDAAAAMLSMVGYKRIAFADQVRREVMEAIQDGVFPRKAFGTPLFDDMLSADEAEVWAKPTSSRMRRILQWWGTDYRRSEDPDYWVKEGIAQAEGHPRVVFSDVRFPNESAAILRRGGVIWRIERATTLDGIPDHISETVLDEIAADRTVQNNGHLIDLATKLRELLATA